MREIQLFWLIVLVSFTEQTTPAVQQDGCPPWFVPDNRSTTGCSCKSSFPAVKCGPDSPLLRFGNCMTYNSKTETTEFGSCPYIAHYNTTPVDHVFYIQLPSNVSLLNEFMCGPLNREGPLCGKCKDGYGIALYSYTLECSKCWGHGYGWLLYFFLELFPTTVMYILVVIFHIRATSSPLSALVFMSQIVVYTIRLNTPLHMYIENKVTGFPYVALQVLLVFCGIWSLDFFHSVIPPFCVSSNIRTVYALALEYLVAFYPILLILLTYACIKLHDNNFRVVVWLWRPFHRYFVHFRRRWDSKASIINAFTTFLLLSFSKILFVSFTLLYTFCVHRNAHAQKKCTMYYDPQVECHTWEYSIFAAIAVCVLVIFILFPTTLLILYPTRLFRRCVSCCEFRSWHAVHMFVESFQGQYKDGTNGTRDFRMFSASFLILRILILASFFRQHYLLWVSSGVQCALFVGGSCLYAVLRPYKSNFRDNVDFLTLVLLEVLSLTFAVEINFPASDLFTYCILISILLLGTPHVILIFYVCYHLAKKTGFTQYLKRKCKALQRNVFTSDPTSQAETNVEADQDTYSLPDRLISPVEYESVLPTTVKFLAPESTESNELDTEDSRMLTPVYTYGSIS